MFTSRLRRYAIAVGRSPRGGWTAWYTGKRQMSVMTPPARVVVVGLGRMGLIRTNLVRSNPKFELTGVVDPKVELAQQVAQTFRVTPFQDLDTAIRVHQPDAIVCCSPTMAHRHTIDHAVRHDIPVFTEKPVAESAPQVETLFDLANQPNQRFRLCCGFQRRFDPSYVSALQQLPTIGKPIYANIFFGDHPVPSMDFLVTDGGGDIFMDLSAHDVDYIIQALPGQHVVSVYASGTSSTPQLEEAGVHDNATMVLNFSQGTVVTLFMSRSATYGYDQRVEVFGSKGRIQVGNHYETSTVLSTAEGIARSKYLHSFPERFHQAFGFEMDAFAETILNDSPWPVTKEDCVRVQQIADAAQESAKYGNVVHLEQAD